jgi:hypothetical protein
MKNAARLPFQGYHTASRCVAYAHFWITEAVSLIFSQSREVLRITRYSAGIYGLQLVHPMTYAKRIAIPDDPGYTVSLYCHYRAHVNRLNAYQQQEAKACYFGTAGIDVPDPDQPNAPRNSIMIGAFEYVPGTLPTYTPGEPPTFDPGTIATWEPKDLPMQVSIFDCLEPDKRYIEEQLKLMDEKGLAAIKKADVCAQTLKRFNIKLP